MKIIPAHLAHALSDEQPCRAALLFPGDELAAVCGLRNGEHGRIDGLPVHRTADGLRRWRRVSRYDTEAMIAPEAEPLRQCAYRGESGDRCALEAGHADPPPPGRPTMHQYQPADELAPEQYS